MSDKIPKNLDAFKKMKGNSKKLVGQLLKEASSQDIIGMRINIIELIGIQDSDDEKAILKKLHEAIKQLDDKETRGPFMTQIHRCNECFFDDSGGGSAEGELSYLDAIGHSEIGATPNETIRKTLIDDTRDYVLEALIWIMGDRIDSSIKQIPDYDHVKSVIDAVREAKNEGGIS